jgi:hypothetical protein
MVDVNSKSLDAVIAKLDAIDDILKVTQL